MVNKTIFTVSKYASRKVKNKTLDKIIQKIDEHYTAAKKEAFGVKPLNIGEKETINCLQNPKNSLTYCKSVGNKVRKKYHKTKYR